MRRSTTSASGSAGATNDADAAHLKDQSRVSGIGMTSARTRERLVARLREQGITDNEVLERIRSVPRHMFVDEALASRAYEDTDLGLQALLFDGLQEPQPRANEPEQQHAHERQHTEAGGALVSSHCAPARP